MMRKLLSRMSFLCVTLLWSCNPTDSQTSMPENEFEELVWADEFNTPGLPDTKKWKYEEGYVRNNETQYYTRARSENARIENDHLIIEARNDSAMIDGAIRPITSASITTQDLATWQYGRVEVRAKLPSSLGTWPALWMLGTNIQEVGWPDCGEIDIMEHVGFNPDSVHTTVHTEAFNHVKGTQRGNATYLPTASTDFHIYAIEWHADYIDFFVDDMKVFTFENNNQGWESWPFDQPFYLILNLAFGGAWGGAQGIDIDSLPQQFIIDYVRIYQ